MDLISYRKRHPHRMLATVFVLVAVHFAIDEQLRKPCSPCEGKQRNIRYALTLLSLLLMVEFVFRVNDSFNEVRKEMSTSSLLGLVGWVTAFVYFGSHIVVAIYELKK
jgi:hypothetical protein